MVAVAGVAGKVAKVVAEAAVMAAGVRFCGRAAAMEQVYNVHIVRLIENQLVTKINPPGVKNAKLLIMRQTNNVYVVPFVRIAVTKGTGSLSIPKKLPVLSGAAATN